jgi:hypothetical protein
MTNKYPKWHLLPPKSGPQPQGLNLKHNNVKTVRLEKINGGNRQGVTKRRRDNTSS